MVFIWSFMLYCHFPTKSYDQLQCDTYSPILGFFIITQWAKFRQQLLNKRKCFVFYMGSLPLAEKKMYYKAWFKTLRGHVLCPSCIKNGPGDGLSGPMYPNPIHIIDHLVKTTGCYQVINAQKLDVENQACYD